MSPSKNPYPWLDPVVKQRLSQEDPNSQLLEIIEKIDRKKWLGIKKDIYIAYYVSKYDQAIQEKKECEVNIDNLRSWRRSSAFKKIEYRVKKEYVEKFTMTGLMIVMSGTMVLFFLRAILAGVYFINFSVDAIVGVIGLIILVANFRVKYRMIRSCTTNKDFLLMDISSFVLSALLKMWMAPNFDLTLMILLLAYFIEKQKFKKMLDQIKDDGK